MAWWFAAPLVIWGAKKIYDAVTDDDESSYSSQSTPSLSSEKSRRTKARKKVIKRIVCDYREHQIKSLTNQLATNGTTALSLGDGTYRLSFNTLNKQAHALANIRLLFSTHHDQPEYSSGQTVAFESLDVICTKLLDTAKAHYGDMAGIGSDNKYHESDDPFIKHLSRSAAQR